LVVSPLRHTSFRPPVKKKGSWSWKRYAEKETLVLFCVRCVNPEFSPVNGPALK